MITKTTKGSIQLGLSAAEDLRQVMAGKVIVRGDVAYAGARQIWNGAVNQPALIALCGTAGDLQAALRVARAHSLPLSVRGGGHDWAGRALRHDGLVIDLTGMRQIDVDAQAKVARVAGGATANDLIAATAPHGLAAERPCGDPIVSTERTFCVGGGILWFRWQSGYRHWTHMERRTESRPGDHCAYTELWHSDPVADWSDELHRSHPAL
jgi:hypothetical protein